MGLARRWRIYLVCAAGLITALVAYRAQWTYSECPPTFAAEALAYPVTLDTYQAASPERLRFIAESWPPGAVVTITDAGGTDHVVTLVMREGKAAIILAGIGGLAFLATAVFFFAPRAHRPGLGGFFWISFLYGVAIMVGGVFFPRTTPVATAAFGMVQIGCLATLPAVFLHLTLVFPRRSVVLDHHRWLVPLLSVGAAAVIAWQAVVLLHFFAEPTLANSARLDPAQTAADLFMVACTVAGIVILAIRGDRLERTRERNQVRWLLWGFTIGAAPYVMLRTVPVLLGGTPLLPAHIDRVIELAIPFAFAMAVVRHQFLDIDVIIRRSLIYGLLAAAVVGLYLGAGIVCGRWLGAPEAASSWVLPMALGLGAGMAFLPLRHKLGRVIDRTLFKLSYDRHLVLDRLDRELNSTVSRQTLADAVRNAAALVLLPDTVAVVVERTGKLGVSGAIPTGLAADLMDESPTELLAASRSTSLPESESAGFPQRLADAGFVLAQPVRTQERLVGLILVSGRANDRRYVEPDLEFLADLARVAAQHLERIALIQAVAAETLARERLAEIDRLKSEFLAHVAHDLRTPVTGISWSARNLDDGLAGSLTDDQHEYVQSIAQSCEHLNRLVSNLLEISRLDRTEPNLHLSPASPAPVWQQAIQTVAPLARAKNVTLELAGADQAVPVQTHADKLTEVAVNLLDNAVKYTAPDSSVTVLIHAAEPDGQAVSVRDHGPGLGDQSPEALFARFAQGAPSPSSTRKGFGLGLHIVVTYLELMGGTLAAADHPGGGAVFTCRLPIAPGPSGKGDLP